MNIKITVCCNSVTVLLPNERYGIITEGHGSAIGGRKGVKRKYNRLQRYSWIDMRADVQPYIGNCRICQLKKLVKDT